MYYTVIFALGITIISLMSSCGHHKKGFNYSAHHRKVKAAMRQTAAKNNGNDLINWRCTNNH